MKFSYFFCTILIFCNSTCQTILPSEKRIYPNKVFLNENENLESFIERKQFQFPDRVSLVIRFSSVEHKIRFLSSRKFDTGSHLVCSFLAKQISLYELEIYGMIYMTDYGCKNEELKLKKCSMTRGTPGPTNENELNEFVIPCVKEFLADK